MDVSIIVSKKTLNQLDQFLNYHHNLFVKKLEEDMLTYGKQITKKEELKNDGKIVAWGIEIS